MERAKVKGSLLGVAEFYVNLMEDGSRDLVAKLELVMLCMMRCGVFI